jgi:hypothetical protein
VGLAAGLAAISIARAAPATPTAPAPDWKDTPALLAAATAPVEAELRACVGKHVPRGITLIATRGRDGATSVAMPIYGVGGRGLTAEERCLTKAVAHVKLPPLPATIESIQLLYVISAAGTPPPAVDPAFADWRDPDAALAKFLDPARHASLTACAPKARTVRLIFDLRKHATSVRLPAWQFHAPNGSGTTPPAEERVKTCLTHAIHGWSPPVLPQAMAELDVALPIAP